MPQKVITDFSGYVFVRGVPVLTEDVIEVQKRVGAQLFDESVFQDEGKKWACVNVIKALDARLERLRIERNDPFYVPDEALDVGDPGWLYIAVSFQGIDSKVLGWMRMKKAFRVH